MDKIPRINKKYQNVELLAKANDEECPRLVVLDGANILQGTNSSNISYSIGNLIALLRLLTTFNFEVSISLQSKFILKRTVAYAEPLLKALYHYRIVSEVVTNGLDDLMMLELVRQTNGVVLSGDKFRDHEIDPRYKDLINNNCTQLFMRRASDVQLYKMTTDEQYVHTHFFYFCSHKKFYSTPDNPAHELSTERRVSFNEERRKLILDLCDNMIVQLWELENIQYEPVRRVPVLDATGMMCIEEFDADGKVKLRDTYRC